MRILIANRSEIAIRLQTSISELGHIPLGIYTSQEGVHAPHLLRFPESSRFQIPGTGARAYLDISSIIRVALQAKAEAIIPGYGFLSESPDFAKAVIEAGLIWIGPRPETLTLFGDKAEAKNFARRCEVPVLPSTQAGATLEQTRAFAASLPTGTKLLLKALAGGGGRGIRIVKSMQDLQPAWESCQREAKASFGDDRLFAEPFLTEARHIEVQAIGDGQSGVVDVGERECTLQRRYQKLIELCPSPTLRALPRLREAIVSSALKIASAGKLLGLATFEFLVLPDSEAFYFLECNPRLQVEHTVTEQVYGIDLVSAQVRLALGTPLAELKAEIQPSPRRASLQLRVNAEQFQADGSAVGTAGPLTALSLPSGAGIRVDTAAHPPLGPSIGHYEQTVAFDSVLAKIIVTAPNYENTVVKARMALDQLTVDGFPTNKSLLAAILDDERVPSNRGISTTFVEQNAHILYDRAQQIEKASLSRSSESPSSATAPNRDALQLPDLPAGQQYLYGHLAGQIVSLTLQEGSTISKDDTIAVLESMKMEHTVRSDSSGTIVKLLKKQGDHVQTGEPLAVLQTQSESGNERSDSTKALIAEEVNRNAKPESLVELERVKAQLRDDHPARLKATRSRHDKGHRTAEENLRDLIDPGSFIEYGDLALAAQRTRLDGEALERTRGDSVRVGWASINSTPSSKRTRRTRCAVVVYDYGVLAGTQGHFHHMKLDRIFRAVLEDPAPVILYAEGGGGRPGDIDVLNLKAAGLDVPTFGLLAQIRSRGIPVISIANGNLFAGNAALLGCGHFVIATESDATSIGMGGPAMIEGGGLGKYLPKEVGPLSSHLVNGNIDIVVKDEKEATQMAKRLVSFFQGDSTEVKEEWTNLDEKLLRHAIPASRKRAYDVRNILKLLADSTEDGGFLEVGSHWGPSLRTGFLRIEGKKVGVVASSVINELGGAIDAASALKATRFIETLTSTKTCHLLALCDTPGYMVGPQAERQGGLRAFANYFAASASFQDGGGKLFGLVLRKGYGLGMQALLGGSTMSPFHCVGWPTAEFAPMGVEGAVRLGMKKELESIEDEEERREVEQGMIDEMYERGKAIRMAEMGEIDTVIDPAETRSWLKRCLDSVEPRRATTEQGRAARARL